MSGPSPQGFAGLQATVMALQQQLIQQTQAIPPVAPPAPPTPNIPEAAKPTKFTRKLEQLEQFIHQCSLFLNSANDMDRAKITFVFSYMKSGSALTWAEMKLAEYSAANWDQTWDPFLVELRGAFGDVS